MLFYIYFQLSEGLLFPSLKDAITTYVEEFCTRLSQACRHVEQQKAAITDDWTVFTSCLNLIHASGK